MIELSRQDLLMILEAVDYRKETLASDPLFYNVVDDLSSIGDRISDIILALDETGLTAIEFDNDT